MSGITENYIEDLKFHLDIGIDEVIIDNPINWLEYQPKPMVKQVVAPQANTNPRKPTANQEEAKIPSGTFEYLKKAEQLLADVKDLEQLKDLMLEFEGSTLRRTASNIVFGEGKLNPDIMVIGAIPNADDDRVGKTYQGIDGMLLNSMLKAIGLVREDIYLTHFAKWRTPGNRSLSESEVAISIPFIKKHIELVNPKIIVFMGELPAQKLLNIKSGIGKLRGVWNEYESDSNDKKIDAVTIFSPNYLIQAPMQKSFVWLDLLALQGKIESLKS